VPEEKKPELKKTTTKSAASTTPMTPTTPITPVTAETTSELVSVDTASDVALPKSSIGTGARVAFALAASAAVDTGADVNAQLSQSVPAFGNVLVSIGNAVAASQQALDKSVVDTVKKLNDTKIKVVTQVIQELDDDGIPDASKTKLVTNEVSVLNYFTPTFHQWDNVSISMDLAVGAFHSEQGVQFNKQQETASAGGSYLWGFGGWFNFQAAGSEQSTSTQSQQDSAWSSGQCLIDAQLGPRRTGKFPVPAAINIGPQIYVTQGAVTEQKTADTVTGRSVDILIELRKRGGEAMQKGVNIVLEAGALLPSFTTGSSTDANGKVKLTLTRSLSAASKGFQKFPLGVSLGSIHQPFTVTL
jgi:hypothetical protein